MKHTLEEAIEAAADLKCADCQHFHPHATGDFTLARCQHPELWPNILESICFAGDMRTLGKRCGTRGTLWTQKRKDTP